MPSYTGAAIARRGGRYCGPNVAAPAAEESEAYHFDRVDFWDQRRRELTVAQDLAFQARVRAVLKGEA